MNKIIRFFDELRNPRKKCERVGHKERTQTLCYMMEPWKYEKLTGDKCSYGAIAVKANKTEKYCGRCDKLISAKYRHRSDYHSVTMPSNMADRMEKYGMVRWG